MSRDTQRIIQCFNRRCILYSQGFQQNLKFAAGLSRATNCINMKFNLKPQLGLKKSAFSILQFIEQSGLLLDLY